MAHDAPALPHSNHAGFTKGELATLMMTQGLLAGGAKPENLDALVKMASDFADAALRAASQRR
jgi:hypothetical protein